MKVVSVAVLALLCCGAKPLPKDTRAAFERGDAVVTLPPGEWTLPSRLEIRPGTRKVTAYGSTLVPTSEWVLWLVSSMWGTSAGPPVLHATGTITPGTDALTLAEPADLAPGEVVVVQCGVRPTDPNEPVREVWQTVKECDGKTVTFAQSFAEAIPVYQPAELTALTGGGYLTSKVGEWGAKVSSGHTGRGYGTDHGILRFPQGVVENVTVEGLTVRWPDDSHPNGATTISVGYARNVTLRDVVVTNPRGKTVHSYGADGLTVDGLTIRGEGRDRIYNTVDFVAHAITAYGGRDLTFRRIRVDAPNVTLWSFERGATATFEDVSYRSKQTAKVKSTPFGSFPGGDPVTVRRGRFDVEGAEYLFAWSAPVTVFEDCEFVRPLSHHVKQEWARFRGTVTIGGKRFGPAKRQTFTKTFDADGVFELPAGIYQSATVTVSNIERVRTMPAPDEPLVFDGATAPVPASRWHVLPPGFPETSEQYARKLLVYLHAGDEPVTVTVEAEYLPEQP